MNLTVKNLIQDKKYFDDVVDLIYEEWGKNNFDFWYNWVKSSMSEQNIPMTFIVLNDDALVGTFSLWRCDLQSRQDLYPWLGGIVVKKEFRGNGIGIYIQKEAKKILMLLELKKAYLFTEMTGYYEKTGWKFICTGVDETNNQVRIYEICLTQ